MRRGGLLTQVLLVNLLLIAAAVVIASIATNTDSQLRDEGALGIVLGFALAATVAVNVFLLSRRFAPLEELVDRMEMASLDRPAEQDPIPGPEEVRRLDRSFRRMLLRLEGERHRSSRLALQAQERERARIAVELHDEVNQSLTALMLRIEAVRTKAPAELHPDLEATREVAAQAMKELVSLARQLRPTALDDLGLRAALAGLVEEIDRQSPIKAFHEIARPLDDVDPDVALATYRIAQEALSNAVRHAGASNIRLRLLREGSRLRLRVTDDGAGFDPKAVGEGLGLEGMRERARLIDAELAIESRPGEGTRVRLEVSDADIDGERP